MKKFSTKLTIALIYLFLGFSITNHFKNLRIKEVKAVSSSISNYDIVSEVESLKSHKADIEKKNNDILAQLEKYEQSVLKQNEFTMEMKKELDNSRILLGLKAVTGPGIFAYLTPKPSIFNNINSNITDDEITHLINELYFAGAEAISINNLRITSQSIIMISKDHKQLLINEVAVPVNKQITIKAIGDKINLEKAVTFPTVLDYGALAQYEVRTEKSDTIEIEAYAKSYNLDFIKEMKEK